MEAVTQMGHEMQNKTKDLCIDMNQGVTAAASDQPCLVSASCDDEGMELIAQFAAVTTCDGCSVSALQALDPGCNKNLINYSVSL